MDRATSEDRPFGTVEMLAWAAGMAALAGLVIEVVRRSSRDPATSLLGGMLVLYVVYIAFSLPAFWKIPRVAVPMTLLIGGALWTFALHQLGRPDLTRALISTIFVPPATTYSIRLIFPGSDEDEGLGKGAVGPSLVHSLLDRGMGFGGGSDRAYAGADRIPLD